MKNWLALGGGILLGNFVFERWIVKKEDGSGFVEMRDGMGIDDGVRALFGGAGVLLARKLLKV